MSTPPGSPGVKRRDFLKILGATGAATAAVGCGTEDVGRLIPYVQHPDQTVPGVSNYYATTCRECSGGCGVIAETRDGRTIKLEGNLASPVNRGALCARGQAALQGLYNPDRYRGPMIRQGNGLVATDWNTAMQRLSQLLGEARSRGQAGGAAFLNQHETGSFPAFLDQWLAGFGMPAHLSVDADLPGAVVEANRRTYGAAWPRLDFGAARLVVSFGADFLDSWGHSVPQQLDWADARARAEGGPRMVYIGPRRSLTGLNADEWIPCKAGSELAIANALRAGGDVAAAATAAGVEGAQLQRLASELASTRPSLVLAGGTGPDALELALAVAELNRAAGNVGTTIRTGEGYASYDRVASHADLRALLDRMKAGQVPMLMVRGVNPVYSMPKSMGFREALARVPVKISFSSYPDETTELCDLVLPDHHPLESWGDAEPVSGTLGLQQPTMDPVFDTRATADVLIAAGKADQTSAARYGFADYRSWLTSRFPGGQAGLAAALPRGMAAGSALAGGAAPARTAPAPAPARGIEGTQGDYYLVVYPTSQLGADGRGANKPWLQELPDPVSKVAWQSWVEMHPQTARRLGVENGDLLTVTTQSGTVTAPAYLYLGIRPDTVAVALGRGHRGAVNAPVNKRDLHLTGYGRYADGVGVNAYDLLGAVEDGAGQLALTQTRAQVTRAGDHVRLVTTEGSGRQHGRGIGQALIVPHSASGAQVGAARPATGGEHADEIATQGTPGSGRDVRPQGEQPRTGGAAGGEGAAAGGSGGEHQAGVASGPEAATGAGHDANEGEHEFPGDTTHAFLPGLRSPTANDAQGLLGDPDSKDLGMYGPDHWSGMAKRRWAMTIDLARCTGCSACVTACYAENNIPTVGAAWQGPRFLPDRTGWGSNITRGREMAWIRLERYYEGAEHEDQRFDPNFETRVVPMLCQHCGNAPCEPVCPVYATYHSPDGLNVQVYNRCVGTRYCSNNCPYKVRYFNWFGYGEPNREQYAFPEPLDWQLNPDVTVRGKGVMEKCTFCVQRIREAENRASLEKRALQPDEFTVACAQACPSRAITFGDASDETWSVAQLVNDRRAYHVFDELSTYTAVVYLKKVTHLGPGQPEQAPAGGEH
ncbi:MAG TPA: 4Fe-4S dicluster domain-containing protein [Gemmatimonadaceae bacterium]|nr:4Fe-4S dicluster domain-containing protein [Gemmatimonadaceae bacterium]